MSRFGKSIKFRIFFALAACVALMVAIGVFGLFGLSRLNANVHDAYTGNTLPISELSEIRAATFETQLRLRLSKRLASCVRGGCCYRRGTPAMTVSPAAT